MKVVRLVVPVLVASACASRGASRNETAVEPAPSAPPPAATIVAETASASPPAIEPPPASPVPAAVDLGTFVHTLSEPVRSLALGEPRVAALGDEPWLFEHGAWKKLPLPPSLRPRAGEHDEARIFFGRDDRARIMGTRFRAGGRTQLYLRFRNDAWHDERGEIAKLREPPPEGLFGVLGHADPEVVCKMGDDCIVKRRTGWKLFPAGPGSPRVELHDGVAWALYPDGVARLDDDRRWLPLGAPAPFHDPGGVWASNDDVWVSEPAAARIHRLHGTTWTSEPAPFAEPRGLWGTAPNDVWLAGADGLAHWDGTTWSRVAGPSGPLAEVEGRGAELWAAGASGVWVRTKR